MEKKTNNLFTIHQCQQNVCSRFSHYLKAQMQEPYLCTWRSSLSSHGHQCRWCQGWKVGNHQHQAAAELPWRTSPASHCCENPWCSCLASHTGYCCVTRVERPLRDLRWTELVVVMNIWITLRIRAVRHEKMWSKLLFSLFTLCFMITLYLSESSDEEGESQQGCRPWFI